jgi:hypothetical protein
MSGKLPARLSHLAGAMRLPGEFPERLAHLAAEISPSPLGGRCAARVRAMRVIEGEKRQVESELLDLSRVVSSVFDLAGRR